PTLLAAAAALASLGAPPHAQAWSTTVHQTVTTKAIDTLPKPLKGFYEAHRLEMPSLAPEADLPAEGTERRFAVDRLKPFPFVELPRTEAAFQEAFADKAREAGRLPWLLLESHDRLVEAFRARDKARILAESDVLAQLVADLHNPLALTDNSDGQKTGQHGLWVRFTTKLPESMKGKLKLDADAAHLLEEPRAFVFSMINATYVWLDNLLYEEELAKRGKGGYTEIYFDDLATRVGPLLRQRLSHAAAHAGSYWYTAWTAAGRPELK
ncbi:MAG TPA: hypothetical protein VFO85_06745, partial [Vicinamibacteria bacterium]|nr:hypothetical protein [Vicinamibacteria bacterium]